jgi:hypothetical protein
MSHVSRGYVNGSTPLPSPRAAADTYLHVVIFKTRSLNFNISGFHIVVLFNLSEELIYRVSQEECARLRENVPYVKVYRYNPKHLYPKLKGLGDNGQ